MRFSSLYQNPVSPLFAFLAVVGVGSFVLLPLLTVVFGVTGRTRELIFVLIWVLACIAGFLFSVLYLRELAKRVRVSRLIFVMVPSIFVILCLMVFMLLGFTP